MLMKQSGLTRVENHALANKSVFMEGNTSSISQCSDLCQSVCILKGMYDYQWEFMVGYIQTYKLYDSIALIAMNGKISYRQVHDS